MNALSPIEIPELLLLIASFLEQRHVVVCLEVCRSWNELLLPLIWKSVAVGDMTWENSLKGPSYGNLEHHSHHVFELKVIYPCPLELHTLAFPNLHTLKLTYNAATYYILRQFNATQFFALSPSLVYLSIGVRFKSETDAQFWKAVSGLPQLKRMRVGNIYLGSGAMNMFWNVCSKLEDIHLLDVGFPENGIQLAEWSFPRVRKLVLTCNSGVTHTEDLEIIRRCTNLEDLQWHTRSGNNIYEFVNALEQGSLPRLERLKTHCSGQPVTDKTSERIIGSMQQIIKLSFSPLSECGILSFQALHHHFSTLADLTLLSGQGATSAMLQELLCSCPLLEKLRGKYIQAKDAVEGRAWVCHSMKHLEVSFRFGKSEQGLQPLVFRRLSSLVLIENFDICDFYTGGTGIHLDMRLASGLEQLSHWKNIKRLDVGGSMQSMEEADIRWVITNWTRLDTFYGPLNEDKDMKQRLKEMLKARGIKC